MELLGLKSSMEEESAQDNTQDKGVAYMGEYKPPFTITNKIFM